MADFPFVQMTARGLELQAKAQTGQPLKFLRVELGDGAAPPAVAPLTALVSKQQNLPIIGKKTPGNGTAELLVVLTNEGLASGFFMRELGVIVEDPDTAEEVLYSYTNAGQYSDYMPAYGGASIVEQTFNLITVIGNAANVTAVINDSLTYALKKDLLAIIPRLLPTGGTVGQMLRKRSNAEGDYEHFNPALDGFHVNLSSVEEPRVAVANQRTFTLQKTITNGLAVYVGSVDASGAPNNAMSRLSRAQWTALSATQLQLNDPLAAKTPVLFVNNEEAGPSESIAIPIEGPTLVYPGSTNTFTIGAYDSFSPYSQSSTAGTLTRSGKTLTLVIPANAPAGTLDIKVARNGVEATRRVAVGAAAIATPQQVAPAAGATGVGFEPDLSIAPFVVYPAGYDVLRKTRWQVALDAAFTQMVYNAESTTNLEAINLGAVGVRLDPSRQYWWRAQCTGDTLTSQMSAAVSFNTAAVYIRRPSLLNPIDGQINVSTALTFQGDAFSVYGGADTHLATRLQYSYVADFSTVAYDTGFQSAQLISIKPPSSLPQKTEIFVRLKYRGTALGDSEWSPVVRFVTSDKLKGVFTQLSKGPAARMDACSAVVNGKIYLFGGRVAASSGSVFSDVWEYTISTNTWRQVTTAGRTAANSSAVVIDGLIYLYGGTSTSGGSAELTYNKVHVFNPATGTMTQKATASPLASRVGHVAGVIDGKMYICGGSIYSTGATQTLLRYTPATDTWETLAPGAGLFSGLFNSGTTANGKLYILQADKLLCYNPGTNTWSQKANYPGTSTSGYAVTAVDNILYVYGGYYNVSGTTYPLNGLYAYDIDADTWTYLGAGGDKTYGHSAAAWDRAIYWHGGSTGAVGGGLDTHWKAQ